MINSDGDVVHYSFSKKRQEKARFRRNDRLEKKNEKLSNIFYLVVKSSIAKVL
jgi:hypothetical protein